MFNKLHINDSNLIDKVIDCVLLGKNSVRIISESNRSDIAESNRIKLKSLYRNVTQIERETGLQETYLGFPFLVGHVNDDESTYIRGPVGTISSLSRIQERNKVPRLVSITFKRKITYFE